MRQRAFVAAVAAGVALLAAGFAFYAYVKAEKQNLIAIQQSKTAEEERNKAEKQKKIAEVERDKAERQRKIAISQRLATESNSVLGKYPQRAILLAVEAVKANEKGDFRVSASEQALRNALLATSGYGLCDHKGGVTATAISADSRWLVTASADKTARLWDLTADDASKTAVVLRGHEDAVLAAAISADSRWLVTASADKTARLWVLKVDELIDAARIVTGRNLYQDEWKQYFQGEQYRKTFLDLPDGR